MTIDHRDILLKSASLIEEGWCRNALFKGEGGKKIFGWPWAEEEKIEERCIVGALSEATWILQGKNPHQSREWHNAMEALREEVGHLVNWNNHEAKNAQEIADITRKVATYE